MGDLSLDQLSRDVVSKVNPDYGKLGTKMNCRRCTFAYEMRRRGYDVKATKSAGATGQTAAGLLNAIDPKSNMAPGRIGILRRYYKEKSLPEAQRTMTNFITGEGGGWGKTRIGDGVMNLMDPKDKSSTIFNALRSQPDGARGELGVKWTMGGGHSMAWEIVKGQPVIFDTQSGKTYKTPEDFDKFAKVVVDAGFTRLDNVELNPDFLLRWLTDAK